MNIFSVSDITKYLKDLFEYDDTLAMVMVRGEISNFKRHYSGHCYFTLKDSNATIKSVLFKSRAQFLKFVPQDGMKVIVTGRITVFERDGQYQLYGEQMIPDGIGELSLAFAQLKEKLTAEGLFDEARKRPLPLLPARVGIITSATGAVLRDIITVSKRRHPGVSLVLYPVLVQGPEAPPQIVRALKVFNQTRQAEVIIVGRGGGSLEDLWAFNDERVVRAVAASAIPVVSAVGHQTDYTLTDFAADRRAATPSQAAELVVPDVHELKKYLTSLESRLRQTIQSRVQRYELRLKRCLENRVLRQPQQLWQQRQQQLDNYMQELLQTMSKLLESKRQQLVVSGGRLALLNPLAVLARGYSITRHADGRVLKDAAGVIPGEQLEVILQHGRLDVTVNTIAKEDKHG